MSAKEEVRRRRKFGRTWSIWSKLFKSVPDPVEFCRNQQIRTNSARIGSRSAQLWPSSPELGQSLSNNGRRRPKLGRNQPTPVRSRSRSRGTKAQVCSTPNRRAMFWSTDLPEAQHGLQRSRRAAPSRTDPTDATALQRVADGSVGHDKLRVREGHLGARPRHDGLRGRRRHRRVVRRRKRQPRGGPWLHAGGLEGPSEAKIG